MTEKIVVIGGGHSGTIVSALLSSLKRSDGSPQYEVALVEEKSLLLDGASKIIDRLHLGGEYPLDEKTSMDCLRGGIIFKQMLPDVYIPGGNTKYIVSRETQEKGTLTLSHIQNQYKKLQFQYGTYFQEFSSQFGREKASEILFGAPKDFFKTVTKIPEAPSFIGGICTQEKTLNPVILGTFLENYLKESRVRVYLNHKVRGVNWSAGLFKINTVSNDKERIFECNQVVNASWESAFYLNSLLNPQIHNIQKIHVYLRCMAILDISSCDKKPGPIFGMLGDRGGSYTPMNDEIAFAYLPHPSGAYLDDMDQTPSSPQISDEWKKMIEKGPRDEVNRMQNILSLLSVRYPFLKKAKVLKLIVRPTLASNNKIEERRHINIAPINLEGTWVSAISLKSTFSPLLGLEVLKQVQENSLKFGFLTQKEIIFQEKEIPIILPDFLKLRSSTFGTPSFKEDAKFFAKKRGFPPSIVFTKKKEKKSEPLSYYTEPLYFSFIYTPSDFEEGISVKGIHIHSMKQNLLQGQEIRGYSNKIPPHAVVQHGTINDLYEGRFNASFSEKERRETIEGDVGISSYIGTSHGIPILEYEGIIANGRGFMADYNGVGRKALDPDLYSFLQVFSLVDSHELSVTSAKSLDDLIQIIHLNFPDFKCFGGYFSAHLLKEKTISKLISGKNKYTKETHQSFQQVLDQQRNFSGQCQPDVAHVVSISEELENNLPSILMLSSINLISINQFLVCDKKGEVSLCGKNYRSIHI